MLEMSDRLKRKMGERRPMGYLGWIILIGVILFLWFFPASKADGDTGGVSSRQLLSVLKSIDKSEARQAVAQEKQARSIGTLVDLLRKECKCYCKD